MPLAPIELVARLSAIMPDFAGRCASPDNLFRNDDGSFSLCGVFAECSHYVREQFPQLPTEQRRSLVAFIEQCMAEPGSELDTAVATCFLENLVGKSFSPEWEAMLGSRASKFVREWSGA
jgi:hypothetical protein